MSIRQINQSHRYSNVKYIVKSHNMFGIYHRMRFFRYHSTITKEPSLCYEIYDIYITRSARASLVRDRVSRQSR